MGKAAPKMTALVVSAIRNLREIQGSTPKEILNYIVAEYNAKNSLSEAGIQRKLCMALKRGLEYGILKRNHGHYSLNTDPESIGPAEDIFGPMDRGCKGGMMRKRKRARAACGGRKGGKSRSRRRSRRSGGCGGGGKKRRRSRKLRSKGGKSRCKSKSGGRRRKRGGKSRRGKSRKCGGGGGGGKRRRSSRRRGGRRRSRRGKSCGSRNGGEDVDMLAKDVVDSGHRRETGGGGYEFEREERRSQSRSRQSAENRRSQSRSRQSAEHRSRSPSPCRSSGSSDHEDNDENHRDRQGE